MWKPGKLWGPRVMDPLAPAESVLDEPQLSFERSHLGQRSLLALLKITGKG